MQASLECSALGASCRWQRRRRCAASRPRASSEQQSGERSGDSPADAVHAAASGPAEAVVWGGTLPSGRRAFFGALGAAGIALGGNLGGVTTAVLSLSPDLSRALRLDSLFPVDGLKRVVSTTEGYELLVPEGWLADQTIARRKAAQAEMARGPLDPPSLRSVRARRPEEPDSAYGPPGSTGEENISVIVADANAYGVRFSLSSLGTPQEVADKLLAGVIARPGSGKTATLLSVRERRNSGLPLYELEFIVRSETPAWERHNLSLLYGDRRGRLFTLTVQVPEADWATKQALLRECAASFHVFET